ncbi:mono-functional DNA-alkylating methyl methanesulfonate N-term-domain-containing protein [Chytridium lagenaria]|nr:mono-functional DNA-alkylating methyl methanesulfonate N-term-domain-containing protein [Chytridium lagenaria]
MPSDWSFYADHPVKSSVIKRILPCSLHENQDGKDAGQSIEAVLVKETTLELVLFDVAKSRWKSLLEQPLFGVIKDCGVVNRNSGTDLLACVSDSGYLSFVHVLDAEVEDILRPLRFETVHQVEIAAPGSGYGELGHHLAIDHLWGHIVLSIIKFAFRSRALAVTSLRGAIEVWLLEDGLPVIEDEESRGTLFKVNEKGTIWEAIFIETSADATPLLSLVTIIDSNAFIVVYECGFAGLKRSYQVALPSDCIPVKVIPLNISHCFLAATETQLIFVDVRDPSHPSITRCQMPTERKDGETETPLVSSLRQSNLNTSSGLRYIYATFDNGDLGVLEYLLGSDTIQLVCLLNRNPISDLAILITGQASEVLGLLGDMCDGEIVRVDFSSNEVVSTGIIQNCAPVLDFKLADLGNNEFSIFSTIGHGSKGCVKEIRRGINVEPRLSIDEFYASAMSGLWTVSYDEKKNLNIVILSFICETRVLMIEDEELYDVSDSTGFDLGQTTLFAGSFSSDGLFLLQVTNQSVLVTFSPNLTGSDGSTYKQRWQPDDDSILLATQYMDCIALSLSKSREIVILKVLADGSLPSAMIAATTRIQVSEDLSCLHPITYSSHYGSAIGLVVGGYSSSVKLLDLNSADHNAVIWEDSLASQSFLSFPPNSVFLLPLWDKDLLFIGSRDGTLFVYESSGGDTGQSKPLFVKKQEVKLGTTPLFLLEYDASGVMCLGEKPCLITASENNIRIGPLCSESLVFARISDKVDYNSRQIAVHETPRRVLYDQFLAKIIVACLINTPSGPTTAIKIVDPVTGNLVESLEPGEICYSLAVWNVKEGKRYICVGTWGFKSGESDTVEGRILVFNLRPYEGKGKRTSGDVRVRLFDYIDFVLLKSKFRMRKLGEFKFPSNGYDDFTFHEQVWVSLQY